MDDRRLFTPDAPGLHVLIIDESRLADLIIRWTEEHPECAIRRLRGQKAVNDGSFFDEAAASWQFPYYFGENWDAFWECIIDLSWIPQVGFLMILDRAEFLLRDSERGFSILMELMRDANEYWRGQRGNFRGEMKPIPFQTLLTSSDTVPTLLHRIEATRVTLSHL